MNELNIKILDVEPAKIDFNYQDIINELEGTLKKYSEIVHTEETTVLLRKDIAKLRKGKETVNRFRIDEKNKMLLPIKEFEKKTKEIEKKFDEVLDPLTEQEKEFEEKRRNEKMKRVEEIRGLVYNQYDLGDTPIEALVIENKYLNKTMTFVKIEEEIKDQAEALKQSLEAQKANEDIIKLTVESLNAKHDLNLSETPYLTQLHMYSVESVKETIEQDVETEIKRVETIKQKEAEQAEEKARLKAEREEEAKKEKQAEIDLIEREKEQEEINKIIASGRLEEVEEEAENQEETNNYALSFMATESDFNQIKELLEKLNINYMEL